MDWEIPVYLDTRSLIADGKVRPDCGDIRFVSVDDSMFFYQWLEGGCGTEFTRYWIYVPITTTTFPDTAPTVADFFKVHDDEDSTPDIPDHFDQTKIARVARMKLLYGNPNLDATSLWLGHFVIPSNSSTDNNNNLICPHGRSVYVGEGAYVRVITADTFDPIETLPHPGNSGDPYHHHSITEDECSRLQCDSGSVTKVTVNLGTYGPGVPIVEIADWNHYHDFDAPAEDTLLMYGEGGEQQLEVDPPYYTAHMCRHDTLDLRPGHLLFCKGGGGRCAQLREFVVDENNAVNVSAASDLVNKGGAANSSDNSQTIHHNNYVNIGEGRLLRATSSPTQSAFSLGGWDPSENIDAFHTHIFVAESGTGQIQHDGWEDGHFDPITALNHTHMIRANLSEGARMPTSVEFLVLLLEDESLLRKYVDVEVEGTTTTITRRNDPADGLFQDALFLVTSVPPLGWSVFPIGPMDEEKGTGALLMTGAGPDAGKITGSESHNHDVAWWNVTQEHRGVPESVNVSLSGMEHIDSSAPMHPHIFPTSQSQAGCGFDVRENMPMYSNLLLVSRKLSKWAGFLEPEDEEMYMSNFPWEWVSGIIVLVVLCLLVVVLVPGVLLPILFCLRRRVKDQSEVLDQILDLDLVLAEQAKDADTSIAHLRIDKDLFSVEYEDIKVKKKIGQGGSESAVFLAVYHEQVVAFKVFRTSSICQDQGTFGAFETEVSLLSSLLHPNILSFFGATLHPPRVGILMEYCELGDLSSFLSSRRDSGKPFPLKGRIRLLSEVASACTYLHSRRVLHRDLKPENVLVTNAVVAKLCDFGVSRSIKEQSSAKTMKVGTNRFMAPEITLGTEYSESVDVYSFGILLFEVVCETEAYENASTTAGIELRVANSPNFRPEVSDKDEIQRRPWLRDLIVMSWSHCPDDRPSFSKVLTVLSGHLKAWDNKDEAEGLLVGEDGGDISSSSSVSVADSAFSAEEQKRRLVERVALLEGQLKTAKDSLRLLDDVDG